MPRRSAAAVAETRAGVTDAAVASASVGGLEGLTIGGLADAVSMRKSSVFSLFGSREDLQLATLKSAIAQFVDEVWEPVAGREPGRERLLALCERWLAYHEREVMPGGCFLTTATVEFDARPGPLRDAVAATWRRWLGLIERDVAVAVERGELPAGTDPAETAFHLNALASMASSQFQLTRDPAVFARAGSAMRAVLAPPAYGLSGLSSTTSDA
jgi:AcrR family transcriptional regulator